MQAAPLKISPIYDGRVGRLATLSIHGGRSVLFGILFQPLSPDTFAVSFRLRHTHEGIGRVRVGLWSASQLLAEWNLRSTQQWREHRLAAADPGDVDYTSLRLTLTPSRAGTYQIQRGTLNAADPRYVYRVRHQFTTDAAANKVGSLMLAGFEEPIFESQSDADAAYQAISDRLTGEGATVDDLEGVFTVNDGTGIARNVQLQRRSVDPDWTLRKDGLK